MNDPIPDPHASTWGLDAPVASARRSHWMWWIAGCVVLVLVVMGVLGAFALKGLTRAMDKTRRAKVTRDLRTIEHAVDAYAGEHAGQYPSALDVLSDGDPKHAPYLQPPEGKLWLDPWKHPYRYEPPSTPGGRARVFTLGRDDKLGGRGTNADLVNTDLYSLP
jgi:type II secretion system protein G